MVEKIYTKIECIKSINEIAAKLKQMGLNEELRVFAKKNRISADDLKSYLEGKRYCLVDEGSTAKAYTSARSKILDEMLYLKDPAFADVIGKYLLKEYGHSSLEQEILMRHKTIQRCINYLMERAWELVDEESKKQQTQVGMAVSSDIVFDWIKAYYKLDDKEKVEKMEKEAEEKFRSNLIASNENKKPAEKQKGNGRSKKKITESKNELDVEGEKKSVKSEEAQLSLFDVGMTT